MLRRHSRLAFLALAACVASSSHALLEAEAAMPAGSFEAATVAGCLVTIRAQTMGAGGVSSLMVRIDSTELPGAPLTGQTDYSGEFRVSLLPGNYLITLENTSVSVKQNVHVDASPTKLVLISLPMGTGGPGAL